VKRRFEKPFLILVALLACRGGENLGGMTFACMSDGDCASGHVCLEGVCASAVDAGVPDSGTLDAGAPDAAGADAASRDAGDLDAGLEDAGHDAGQVALVISRLLYGPHQTDGGLATFTAIAPIDPGSQPNTVMVVGIGISGLKSACSSAGTLAAQVTDDKGQAYSRFTLLGAAFGGCDAGQTLTNLEIWYSVAPAAGPTTLSVTYPSPPSPSNFLSFGAIAFSGVDPLMPLRNSTSTSQNSGSPTVSVTTTTAAGDVVADILCNGTAAPMPAGSPKQSVGWVSNTGATYCASILGGWVPSPAPTYADTWSVVTTDNSAIISFDVVHAP
jgi:hypothetical protein